MGSKSLLLSFLLISFSTFSQNVTFTASKSSMEEFEIVDITASIASPTDKDIIVDFNYSGTARNESDFSFNFLKKNVLTIIAGGFESGFANNQFNDIADFFIDKDGNIYVADRNNHRVQKWEPGATTGITVAGGNGGGSDLNQLLYPSCVFVSDNGDLYVGDQNNRIQKWAPGATEGVIVAGGNGNGAQSNQLTYSSGIFVDPAGNIYVADRDNHRVQKFAPGSFTGITVAGGNSAGSANNQLYNPSDVFLDEEGNIYVSDQTNHRIQRFSQGSTEGVTVAGGNGQGSNANQLSSPGKIYVDSEKSVYITDLNNRRIQKWSFNAISAIKIFGDNYTMISSSISIDAGGNIYFAGGMLNNQVYRLQKSPQITIKAGETTDILTVTGIDDNSYEDEETVILTPSRVTNGTLENSNPLSITITSTDALPTASFSFNGSNITENSASDALLTATLSEISGKDVEINFTIEGTAGETTEYLLASKTILIQAGSATGTLAISTKGLDDSEVETLESIIFKVNTITNATAVANTATLYLESDDSPSVALTMANSFTESESLDIVATLDAPTSRDVVIDIDLAGTARYEFDFNTQFLSKGAPSTVAGGNGNGSRNDQMYPRSIFVDLDGNIYVADLYNHRIQKWLPGAKTGITVAGGNELGAGLNQFNLPSGVYVDESGNIYVSDAGNNRVQKWTPGAVTGTTVAGGYGAGSAPNQLSFPQGLIVDLTGTIFVADQYNNRVQKWVPKATAGITVAGGKGDGSGVNQLNYPNDVFVDLSGNIFVSDQYNYRIQKWTSGVTTGVSIASASQPFGIHVDKAGNLYCANLSNNNVTKWVPDPNKTNSYNYAAVVAGIGGYGSESNQLKYPRDVFVDKGGNVYVADADNYRVQKYQYAPQIVIKAGQTTGKITIAGINDSFDEVDKTILVTPLKVTDGVLADYSSKTIDMIDNDEAPVVTLSLSSEKIAENSSTDVMLKATLSMVSEKDIQINFTVGGTAIETTEYKLSSKSILIPAGKNSDSLSISTKELDDSEIEILKSIEFTVSSITNATAKTTLTTLYLESDDSPKVTFAISKEMMAENESIDVTATLEAPASKDVVIDIEYTGTSRQLVDFTTNFVNKGTPSTIYTGSLSNPKGVHVDNNGNVYIADSYNHRIQKWTPGDLQANTVAGIGGYGSAANQLKSPVDVFVDKGGNIFITDQDNNRIIKYTPGAIEGIIVAGGNGAGSNANQLNHPREIFIDESGNIFIADESNNRIQKWTPGATEGITVAGGVEGGSNANQFNGPVGIAVSKTGTIYVADYNNCRVQKWLSGAKEGVTVAGGHGSSPTNFESVYGLAVDAAENLYVVDQNNHRIQKFLLGSSEGITVAGGNSYGMELNQLYYPADVFVDKVGNIYVADMQNNRIQKYLYSSPIVIKAGETTGKISIVGNDDKSDEDDETIIISPVNVLNAIIIDNSSKTITITDNDEMPVISLSLSSDKISENSSNDVILTATSSEVSGKEIKVDFTLTGSAIEATEYSVNTKSIIIPAGNKIGSLSISTKSIDDSEVEILESINFTASSITNAEIDSNSITLMLESDDLPTVSVKASTNTIAEHQGLEVVATLNAPSSKDVTLDIDLKGTAKHSLDFTFDFLTKGTPSTLVTGNFNGPSGICLDSDENILTTDMFNQRIKKWNPNVGQWVIVAGNGEYGPGPNQFKFPADVFVDLAGNIYVSDIENHRVQKWVPGASTGVTVAGGKGSGSNKDQLNNPKGIFVDLSGNIYIADQSNHRIQKWSPGATIGITVAGGNGAGSNDNQLYNPSGVVLDDAGIMYIADNSNCRIQKWVPGSSSGATIFGGPIWGSDANHLAGPSEITLDQAGYFYIVDQNNHRIQKFKSGELNAVTIAGNGAQGQGEDQLNYPSDVCVDRDGNIYIADKDNQRIQKYLYAPQIVIKAGQTTGKLIINGLEDDLNNEGDESIIITAKTVTNAIAESLEPISVTILDNTKTLTLKENPFIGLSDGAVSWGDYDRDGDQDVAVMGQSPTLGAVTAVYENQAGSFVNTNQNFAKLYHGDISWVDVNKDSWIDLVVSGYNEAPKTKLYINNEGKSFIPTDDYGLPQLYESKMAWGDLDNDGDIDLAISGINSSDQFIFQVYYRDDNQDRFVLDDMMASNRVVWPGFINGDLKIVDIDLDGDNDVIYNGEMSSYIGGAINFNSYIENTNNYYDGNLSLKKSSIEIARLNSDDINLTTISSGEEGNGNIRLSSSKFLTFLSKDGAVIEGPKLKGGDISIADYDSDGLNDIIFTGEDKVGLPITKLFFQDRYGRFKESDILLKGLRKSTADWVDYDMDGDLDLFLTGEDATGAKTLLYESATANKKNMPPSIITGLKTEHLGNGKMRFSWDKPSDDFSTNLGYVIRIGTTPRGSELSNTESDLETGRRLITKPASIYTNFYETQLNPGIYYWSVQAIDPGLKGGAFAEEQTFTLTYEWKILNQGGILDRRIAGVSEPVIKLGDIDNDNDMDLIYGSAIAGSTQLLKFDGKRLTASADNILNYIDKISDAEVGDVNGDGTSDILINNAAYNGTFNLMLFMSNGNGFDQTNIGSGLYKAKGRIIDLNNDGQAEVVLLGLSSNMVSGKLKMIIYSFNKTNNSFTSTDVSSQIASISKASFDLGDIDNDQDIDLILSGFNGTSGYQCYLYENTTEAGGSYKFTNSENNLVAVIDGTSDLIDFDGDGDLDVVITGTSIAGDVFEIYENLIVNGKPTFTRLNQLGLTPMREGKIDLGDFNGDGYSDLLYSGTVSGAGKTTSLSEYKPLDKSYTKSAFDVSDIINAEVEFGDFEGDGDLDFAISGENSEALGTYSFRAYINVRNESAKVLSTNNNRALADFTVNEPPTAPVLSQAKTLRVQDNGKVLTEFSWNASADDHTPVEGLTYALRIGKTPGSDEIMSANSNTNGIRKSAAKGNVEHNLKWHLALPEGIYYWSVQAVDASYSGSSFTSPQKLVVTNTTVGIDDVKIENQLTAYPNPTNGLFYIVVPGNEDHVKVAVRNATGTLISESEMLVPSNRILNMNISNLNPGVYFISIQSTTLNHMVKVVKN